MSFLIRFNIQCLNTVDSRNLDLAYLEKPLILKWKSGPCLNMKI